MNKAKRYIKSGLTGVFIAMVLFGLENILPSSGIFPNIFGILFDLLGIPVKEIVQLPGVTHYPERFRVYLVLMIPYAFIVGLIGGEVIRVIKKLNKSN